MLIIHDDDVILTFVILSETSSFYELNWLDCMFCHVQICTLNVHINICFCMGFRHVHVCTNDYPYSYVFSSCTCFYEWLSILCLWVFVMYMFVRMTIHFFWMGFRHVHVRTHDYQLPCAWVLIMHISVRMSIHFFWKGFRHAHFCTDDYPFLLNVYVSVVR